MRTLIETPRGCGYRKDGGCYLTADISSLGSLPTCVTIEPPTPLDTDVIKFTRGIYIVNFDAVMTESDQRLWLIESSKESLRARDAKSWELDRYGMSLDLRLRSGICVGLNPEQAEQRLSLLKPAKNSFVQDYIISISKQGRGRAVARETAVMQKARIDGDWVALLAACWRLSGYSGRNESSVKQNLKRIMVVLGAVDDAVLV